jgi:hypothetical protein
MAEGEGVTDFWVKVTNDSGCSSSDTILLNFAVSPEVDLGADTVICHNSSITLDAGNPGSTYEWSTGDTTQTIIVNAEDYEYGLEEFTCEVTNSDGCRGVDEITIEIKDCTGIDEISARLSLDVYPNPSNGTIKLNIETMNPERISIKVLSISGKLVYREDNVDVKRTFSKQLHLGHLAEGVYSVFISSDEKVISKKIVIQK